MKDDVRDRLSFVKYSSDRDPVLTGVTMHWRKLPDIHTVRAQNVSKSGYSARSSSGINIKSATYDGTCSWIDYPIHFDARYSC